jgi:hypothetical protein
VIPSRRRVIRDAARAWRLTALGTWPEPELSPGTLSAIMRRSRVPPWVPFPRDSMRSAQAQGYTGDLPYVLA